MRHRNGTRQSPRHLAETGCTLPTAILILLVITLLTGAAIALATQSSTSTTRDNNVKAEIEAAEAGLHIASYRLSQLKPSESQCISETTNESTEANCKNGTESLGNGATFHYATTKPLKAGSECAGKVISIPVGTTLRCVTSEGKVNGVEPAVRLQARVKSTSGEALFSVKGILGLDEVKVTGNVEVPAVVASNGKITGEGSANFVRGYEVCPPGGSFKPAAGAERLSSGVKIHGESPGPTVGYEITRKESECPFKASLTTGHATAASNEDSRIGKEDAGAGYEWNAATYELKLDSVDTLTLGGGKYFFCNLTLGPKGSGKLKIKPVVSTKVEIFIGSPEESESVCAAGTGKFLIEGGNEVINEDKKPAELFIQLAGKGPFKLANGSEATLEAAIYAPNGEVIIKGGQKFTGGIVGKWVKLENGSKINEWSEELSKLTNGSPSSYTREAWEQCVNTGSGC